MLSRRYWAVMASTFLAIGAVQCSTAIPLHECPALSLLDKGLRVPIPSKDLDDPSCLSSAPSQAQAGDKEHLRKYTTALIRPMYLCMGGGTAGFQTGHGAVSVGKLLGPVLSSRCLAVEATHMWSGLQLRGGGSRNKWKRKMNRNRPQHTEPNKRSTQAAEAGGDGGQGWGAWSSQSSSKRRRGGPGRGPTAVSAVTSTDEEGSELDATDLQFMMGEGSDEFSGGEEGEESGTDSDGSGEYIFMGEDGIPMGAASGCARHFSLSISAFQGCI